MFVAEKDGTPDSSIGYLRDDWDVFIQLSEKKKRNFGFYQPQLPDRTFCS